MRVWASPEAGFVVTVPLWHQDPASVERFLQRHRRWLLRQAGWLADVGARTPKRWPYGPTLPYRGEEHEVVVEPGDCGAAVERTPERTLLVRTEQPGLDAVRRLLKRWYAGEAARWVAARLQVLSEAVGVGWRRVTIGDSRWRWGSCSATGCLSFNFRLVMAPPEVMDYVIVHELAHRRALNHSERFWALVAARCPDHRRWRAWLRTHGPSLRL
jgi:predicted metal-dependent hydrolase